MDHAPGRERFVTMFWKRQAKTDNPRVALRCSFCMKSQEDVRQLIAGPSVYICDECVEICNDIIAADTEAAERKTVEVPEAVPAVPRCASAVRCSLCRMPMPVEDGLLVENRGVLCPGCVDEIQASMADKGTAHS